MANYLADSLSTSHTALKAQGMEVVLAQRLQSADGRSGRDSAQYAHFIDEVRIPIKPIIGDLHGENIFSILATTLSGEIFFRPQL
jgi:hypothetical protein